MSGMIPWSELSGDIVERIMATYICLENPECIHVRPSVGDAGIDVVRSLGDDEIEVYQIKKFASSLTSSQKSQIRKSWERLVEYVQENGFALANWYLVLPLNPTRENLKWFEELTASFETKTCWYGKSHVDAWASKMPYVADYYIDGNKNATLTIAKEFLEAARLPDVTDQEGLKSQLVTIQSLLGDIDPNYTYDFQLLHDFDFEAPLVFRSRPGLVVTTIEGPKQGGAIRIDVLAKHSAAVELAPISGTFTLLAGNDEHKEQLQNYIDFGVPLKSFPAKIATHGEALFSDIDEECIGTVSMYEHASSVSKHEANIKNGAGKTINLIQSSFSQGRKGFTWEGSTSEKMLSVRLVGNIENGQTKIEITGSLEFLRNCSPVLAKRKLKFLFSGFDNCLSFYFGNAQLADFTLDVIGLTKDRIAGLYEIAGYLNTIDGVSLTEVVFPEVITRDEINDLKRIVEIISKKIRLGNWTMVKMNESVADSAKNKCVLLKYTEEMIVSIGEAQYDCGVVTYSAIGQWDDEIEAFIPTKEYGSDLLVDYTEDNQPTARNKGMVSVGEAMGVSEWLSIVKEFSGRQ